MEEALAKLGKRLGLRMRAVILPYANAAIDVDSIADLMLVKGALEKAAAEDKAAAEQAGKKPDADSKTTPEKSAEASKDKEKKDDKAEKLPAPPDGYDKKRDGIDRGKVEVVEYDSSTVGNKRRVTVYTPPGFDPKSGSVSPKHPIASPAARRGSHSCFCSSEPYFQIEYIDSEPCTETKLRIPLSTASSSRHASPYASADVPAHP